MNYFKKLNNIVGWAVFAAATAVYLLTMEPTGSLWDCMEFIATSYKLEVGHPPGAPLFMILARIFTLFSFGNPENVGITVNAMSSIASGFTILFLFWTITHLARKIFAPDSSSLTRAQTWTVIGAGIIGAAAYTFTDTFWFSAIEGEVYALSSMFTALVVWAMLKWEDAADEPHANRWLVLITYLMGLSIGVHILNLLTIPALVFIYYFRKTDKVTFWGVVKVTILACVILLCINSLVPFTVAIGAWFDRMFVNGLGLPVNSGLLFFTLAVFAALGWAIWYTHTRGRVLLNTIALCAATILLGCTSYASIVIRASVNPPMNSNDPDTPYALLSLLNRDQYGTRPLVYGRAYSSVPVEMETKPTYLYEDGKYKKYERISGYDYEPKFLFPRMYSDNANHIKGYKSWGDVTGRKVSYRGEAITVPTFGENLRYFFSYQLGFMYWRYFMWNFVGRQSDIQGNGEITNGNWLSGIDFIDSMYLGPQDGLPSEMATNKGRNTYYFLPFLLGLLGLVYQFSKDKKNFSVVMWLFIMMGVALVVYFNTTPGEPRERDYVYAGSFYAFCIWIGFGVMWIQEIIAKLLRRDNVASAVLATAVCACVPTVLAAQNWDDHDRSHRYVGHDMGYNYLVSTLPNSIIINYGDNDTFPLWYNQEVENVRPDVRIMNMSYLTSEWYIDEMKGKYNESEPVPFSLGRKSYINTNDMVPVVANKNNRTLDISQVIKWIGSDSPVTKYDMGGGFNYSFIPTKRIALPVNKANAVSSGIVGEKDAHLMVDTVYIDLKTSSLNRGEMMFLDLLGSFDWKRPIYFTQPYELEKMGLDKYVQFDGFAYRLVPIRTDYESFLEMGRIDSEYLYDNLMNKYKYGNLKDGRVYADSFINHTLNSVQGRNAFARLAMTLLSEGDTVRAREVIERGMEEIPVSQIRHSYIQTVPMIQAMYEAGMMQQGDELLGDYVRVCEEYLIYFLQFDERKSKLVEGDFRERYSILENLYTLARHYDRKQIVAEMHGFFEILYGEPVE